MKTPPDKTITITYHSLQTRHREMWWRVKLTFPPNASKATLLPLEMVDGLDRPVASAILELAGLRINITDGKAAITYGDFIKGKHEKALWVYRKDMLPIPGALTFT